LGLGDLVCRAIIGGRKVLVNVQTQRDLAISPIMKRRSVKSRVEKPEVS
jgi:hypothetical protein